MIDIDLPRPAVANWTTVRNSMEVIIAENGSVERVKWLGSPRRLPDVMLLSRAKLWKFAPAVKDGQAVRYKLVINWDVNP
jgi:outer membrane biosynthesis protein TonB